MVASGRQSNGMPTAQQVEASVAACDAMPMHQAPLLGEKCHDMAVSTQSDDTFR